MKKTGLLLIDIQNTYFNEGDYLLTEPEIAAKNAKKVLELWRREGHKVIHIQHNFPVSPGYEFLFDIHEDVAPLEDELVIRKNYPSSFYETELLDRLKELEINDLVVVGMQSNMCVDTTVRACKDLGINVILLQDACAAKKLEFKDQMLPGDLVHKVFMASMDGFFAKVMDTKEFIDEYGTEA